MCSTDLSSATPGRVYTLKELVLLETLISEFHEKYYITEIQKLTFHLPHVLIIGTHHCGKEHREEFKCRIKQHDILCQRDYAERILSSFPHKLQSEYYGVNWSVSIKVIVLDNLSYSKKSSSQLTSEAVSCQAVFHSF